MIYFGDDDDKGDDGEGGYDRKGMFALIIERAY